MKRLVLMFCPWWLAASAWSAGPTPLAADEQVGQPANVAASAYRFRRDRPADRNPPESWILLMQYAGLPWDKPVDVNAPSVKAVLCGLLWEEVRPVRQVDLSWPADAKSQPKPDDLTVSYFDATDDAAHTWWNPRTVKEAGKPEVSPDGRMFVYAIPVDTWGVVVAARGQADASAFAVPTIRATVSDTWKKMDLEIEWGFDAATAQATYDGEIGAYDGVASGVQPLAGNSGTTLAGPLAWRSAPAEGSRRGVRLSLLYIGSSRWRREWPYLAQPEDVARTIVTVRTASGSFSFQASDLEQGPILAPEYGFFVRAMALPPRTPDSQPASPSAASEPPFRLDSTATTAREFVRDLAAKGRKTIRQQTREHPEQTWEGAVEAMRAERPLPPMPEPPFEPAMRVEVPCPRLTAQWRLGAWHLLRHAVKEDRGRSRYNDFPFGILAAETYMILRSLDLQGMHQEAADGLDQWLSLPMEPRIVAGEGGHHGLAKPDRPLGHFSDGRGCLTHAEGPDGAGGHMDGVHCMGPGAILYVLGEHFRLTGDLDWLRAHAPRMKADAEWILRQRKLLSEIIPGGERLWSKGLQPAHVVTPDSACMHMQFYETEAYYWLAVHRMAEMLALVDPPEAARMAAEAEAYRKDLLAAIDRSIERTPVVPVRNRTYHSFIPFAPYVRGFAAGAWGWRRCQGHVGAIYWDTVQSADPLVSPSGLLSARDVRVQGHLDVLEDRLLLENTKVHARTSGFDPEKHWFSSASWQYQCGLERHANIHLGADDPANFLRSMLNQYAVDIMPGEYTFREHTTGGPPDKVYEEACFLERFRQMLVLEEGDSLWLARATPRAWLAQGKRIAVADAPTYFGVAGYEIVSDVDHGRITATVAVPSRRPPKEILLRLRHPARWPIRAVTVNGQPWSDFDAAGEVVRLHDLAGKIQVEVTYGEKGTP